jgi:ketosteroid isomerase-like protein
MDAAQNRKLIDDAFNAWVVRGDRTAFNNLLADDLQWTVIGTSPVSGHYNSKREFLERAGARMAEKLATSIQPTVRHVIADGNMVALVFDGRASGKNGTVYHQTYCWVLRVEDGRIREGTAYLDTELITKLFS